jgi:glycosyltransferase involved in cell wall biosynthesis
VLLNAKLVIFDCLYDLVYVENLNTPKVILYNHFSSRPNTFMFEEIIKFFDPLVQLRLREENKRILEEQKQLYKAADRIVSNSNFTKEQLRKYFELESDVVYPPVNVNYFLNKDGNKGKFFLSVQRIHWQKRIDLQLEVFGRLPNEKLLIVGEPTEELKRAIEILKLRNVKVLGFIPKHRLRKIYSQAKAVIQTGFYEDFGIVPIEALAAGTPSIVVDEGGFRETINEDVGIRVKKPYIENFVEAIKCFEPKNYRKQSLQDHARQFGFEEFKRKMQPIIEDVLLDG